LGFFWGYQLAPAGKARSERSTIRRGCGGKIRTGGIGGFLRKIKEFLSTSMIEKRGNLEKERERNEVQRRAKLETSGPRGGEERSGSSNREEKGIRESSKSLLHAAKGRKGIQS